MGTEIGTIKYYETADLCGKKLFRLLTYGIFKPLCMFKFLMHQSFDCNHT